ncbi:DUF4249 domain-containing protein [Rubrivirga sp.]|uniref:DUF4249 domain-containing protein n=1 Tax=Rubrivirga sp. TaxID=1885344 RepID=UPI003B530171
MRRPSLILLAAVLAGTLGACDFTPTLDVPLPDFEPALTLNGVLAADSTVEVRITAAADPYGRYPDDGLFEIPQGTVAELFRDGASLGPLRLASAECPDYSKPVDPVAGPVTVECGAFISDVVVEPGATYTLRASAPGYPAAEATVTVPGRVPVTLDVGPPVEAEVPGWIRVDRDVAVSFRDPAGLGDRYALMAVSGPWTYTDTYQTCDRGGVSCSDTTVHYRVPHTRFTYTTSDPVLLAGARTIPTNGISFATFTDEVFDGEARSLKVRVHDLIHPDRREEPEFEAVWLVAVDAETFGAYQIAWFGYPAGEDFNPFQEPIDLPSNVVGGYGLLGAVTVNAAPVPE